MSKFVSNTATMATINAIEQIKVRLVKREYLSPHLIRLTLKGEEVYKFADTTIGTNNKIFIPPAGIDVIHFPQYDVSQQQWIYPEARVAPAVRTYTHRGIDLEQQLLLIDFVAHGDEGPASAWAIHAPIGAILGIAMRTHKTELYPVAERYILVGDATAIPVISAILEDLPGAARAQVFLEVQSAADRIKIRTAAQVDYHWILNPKPEKASGLADHVIEELSNESGSFSQFAYVAAEYQTVQVLRKFFRKDLAWTKEELYAYSYWRRGMAEDRSAKERQQESRE